ncbi:c-type cytochrome [Pseudoalteromonas sp.]|uniref:c-type cytochrome n=1 Tax=Pseudoalteromonas sp. TaxID=53249 RepID=UPI00356247D5
MLALFACSESTPKADAANSAENTVSSAEKTTKQSVTHEQPQPEPEPVSAVQQALLNAPVITNLSASHPNSLSTPNINALDNSPASDLIRYGRLLIIDTYNQLPNNVNNKLNCSSCHLNEGRVANAAPYVGMNVVYPKFRSRNAKINTLEERINGCFQRSMNGQPLITDSTQMQAIVSYMNFLSQDKKTKDDLKDHNGFVAINKDLVPNADNGKTLYAQHCASCHQLDANGLYPNGNYMFPAVAGEHSFNDGAGMARTYTAAAFIKGNMPLGQEGILTDQQAVDIAYYFSHLARPVFAAKANDWPEGGAPKDARK